MTAIEFENISKQYRLGLVSTNTLSHDLNRWFQMNIRGKEDPYLKIGEVNDRASKGESDYVWALKDINFKVEQGDVLGIIGKNGAGKSTLLKILSKVTAPSTGIIRAKGRIASLLEVGTGFHPEMTGRENIYMNGAIMGMTKAEITRKLDEIVDFSGVERYLDTPVKRYSSGMTVRLGFAIAAHLDPEILVVDEVLAVGDAEFQKKAIGKMQDVSKGEGRTVLFVSHNMAAVEQLCNRCIYMSNGTVLQDGKTSLIISNYLSKSLDLENIIRHGNNKISFSHFNLKEQYITLNNDLSFQLDLDTNYHEFLNDVDISVDISDNKGDIVSKANSKEYGLKLDFMQNKKQQIDLSVKNINLFPADYYVSLWVGDSTGETFDYIENCLRFTVLPGTDFVKTIVDNRVKVILKSEWIVKK